MNIVWGKISETEVIKNLGRRAALFERMPESARENFRKASITIEQGAQVTLPLLPAQSGITILEITQKPSSTLSFSYLQNSASNENNIMIVRLFIEEQAQAQCFSAMFGGASSSLFLETHLVGSHSSLNQHTLFFGSEAQIFDMFSTTTLEAPNTSAVIEAKGVLLDEAQARFDGGIEITQIAKKSEAALLEHTLLLSPKAKMNAIPALTINTNDVRASHAASMTRVDEDQLFYAAARGIEKKEATNMIVDGFLETVAIKTPFANEVRREISRKLAKNSF